MHVLALDTSTRAGSVAIVVDDDVIFVETGDAARPHAERLPAALMHALEATSLSSADIDIFAVVSGPGSFTGLRIGIATQQGMALVGGRRVVAVPTLEALAEAGSVGLLPGALIGTWMDARRDSVFSGLWRVKEGPRSGTSRFDPIESALVGEPRATLARWRGLFGLPVVIVGDGATLYADTIGELAVVVTPPPLAPVVGRMALARALAGEAVDPAGVQPLYVRRSDAEVIRDASRQRALPI